MIEYEESCVDCGQPCLGSGCRYYGKTAIRTCDKCGDRLAPKERFFQVGDEQLCLSCLCALCGVCDREEDGEELCEKYKEVKT